jgi:phosphatidylglycerol lysyltransferase
MFLDLTRRRYLLLWQILLILLGTTWLWAPHLNHGLSYRTTLISQYESSGQPYSLLFRLGDLLAGALVILMGLFILRRTPAKNAGRLVMVAGGGMLLDPVLSTTCRQVAGTCQEYVSLSYVLHAIETTITSAAFFALGIYDALKRKRLVSISFVIFQIGYGLLFVTQLANHGHFNTISQYIYDLTLIVWLAWFGRDLLRPSNFPFKNREPSVVKTSAAAWAFLNGILAILISLAHIHLLGRIKGIYFAGDSAWLAQHGVVVGVVMLYLSRHIYRGERRARQIFLLIAGMETIKYALIAPDGLLMVIYGLTFCGLFIFRDDFQRGTMPMTWQMRLSELYFMAGSLLLATLIGLLSLDRDNRVAAIAGQTFDNFFDYATGTDSHISHLRSVLLAHTITAFLVAAIAVMAWILFRPNKLMPGAGRDYAKVEEILRRYSNSSEDFFKSWPKDKDYFWSRNGQNFVAYKRSGPVVFAVADPIGPNPGKTIDEFLEWTRGRRFKACFMPVADTQAKLYEKSGFNLLQIGSSALVDIDNFLDRTVGDKWWRWKRNRAEKSGYQYALAVPPHDRKFIRQLKVISDAWLKVGGHAERGFTLGYFDEAYLRHCCVYHLKDSRGRVIAFANGLPQFKDNGTASIDLLRYVPEHNDSMPYLIFKAMQSAKDDGNKYFDLGFVPFAKADDLILDIAQAIGGDRFSSKGLEQFKNKFDPAWQPVYLAYDGDIADLALIALNIERVMDLGI